MKIGFTIGTVSVAGGTKALLKYASGLRRLGHEVTVYSQAYSTRNYLRHKVDPLRITWAEEPHDVTVLRQLDHAAPADILVASAWQTAAPVHAWVGRTGGHGLYFVQHHESLWTGGQDAVDTYRLPLAKVVISTWLKEIMKDEYDQDSTLLVTPVDDILFECQSDRPDRARRVLLLHHTFDWKGVDDGMRAVETARGQHPDLQLVVLGGLEEDPPLPDGAEYHFQPDRDALAALYAGCGIFLCPSWHEGLGMPAMEAMATGALLVTTDTGGSRDFAAAGETALVSPPRDWQALAANLSHAVTHWSEHNAIRQAGRERIRTYRWDSNLERLDRLLHTLAGR